MIKHKELVAVALIGAATLLTGCADNEAVRPVVPGEEVRFGAAAAFEDGNGSRGTRTIYGEVNGAEDKIAINWLEGDQVEIACPEAAQAKKATYIVQGAITEGDFNNNNGVSSSATLQRMGDVGLQWSSAATHNFYATYPSQSELLEANIGATVEMADQKGMKCFLPMTQKYKGEPEVAGNVTTLEPDMRYAFMGAHTAHTDKSNDQVELNFKPLVTALQFELSAKDVNVDAQEKDVTITALQLTTGNGGQDIAGHFSYKFDGETLTSDNTEGQAYNSIMMDVPDVVLDSKNTKKLNFTFFLLPTENLDGGVLKLNVFYEIDGSPRTRIATVNRDILARKKYFFKNLVMNVESDLKGSNWFSALDDNIYVNQLSIPMAGNAFSNLSSNGYYREQISDYMTLWNQGVRGFELTTAECADEGVSSLGDVHFVCGEKIFNAAKYPGDNYHFNNATSVTLDEAMKSLLSFRANPLFENEPLVLMFRYHPVSGTIDGNEYLKQLATYLGTFIGYKPGGAAAPISKDDFVQLSNSSTVGDIKGKIVIIVRANDEEYGNTAFEYASAGDWANNITIVKNWGSAYDRWDTRYTSNGSPVAREATWDDNHHDGKLPHVEDYLYGISREKNSFTVDRLGGTDFRTWSDGGFAEITGSTGMLHNSNIGNMYVQEWARVVPTQLANIAMPTPNSAGFRYLWVKWPSSIDQKKTQIRTLLDEAVATSGSNSGNLFINVLSGYYITQNHVVGGNSPSITPYKQKFGTLNNIVPEGQGNGGNYAGLAADLNGYLYDYLTSPNYNPGPLGLIQFDYINATADDFTNYSGGELYEKSAADAATASGKLVELIWQNNFKFPKATNGTGGGNTTPPSEDDPEMSFKTEAANPARPIK